MALSIISHLQQCVWQGFLKNVLVLTLPSLLLFFLLLEIAVRFLLPVSDVPDTYFHPQLGNHYVSNQTGQYVKGHLNGNRPEIAAPYRINAAGWNSPYEYTTHKPDGQTRLAIIGDSYVEALQVAHDRSFPYLLEKRLQQQLTGEHSQEPFRVYSFGHSGANLVQYLNVLRYAVLPTQPDIVIVTLVQNDFLQALTGFSRPDNWSLSLTASGVNEVPPTPSRFLTLKRLVRHSALIRYLFVNLSFAQRLVVLQRYLVSPPSVAASAPPIATPQPTDVWLDDLLHYVCREFSQLAQQQQFQLIFLLAANQRSAYRPQEPNNPLAQRIHAAVHTTASQWTIAVLDLTDPFQHARQRDNKPFEWSSDGHWNPYAHAVVASAVFEFLHATALLQTRSGPAATHTVSIEIAQ